MSAAEQFCGQRFSPQGYWNQVPPTAVQKQLRRAFQQWGLPERFRVDNGIPWGSWGDLPTDLALWLIGLRIDMVWNPPRRPQDNGVVERSQGTGKRWAEPHTASSVHELQQRLERMDRIQRELYPSLNGRSRLEVFPQLSHSSRSYSGAWERKNWSLVQVAQHLAEYAVPRRVDRKGLVWLYNRNHYVGRIHQGKVVYVTFDPELREWVFLDEKSNQLRQMAAPEISRGRIQNLRVTHRRRETII